MRAASSRAIRLSNVKYALLLLQKRLIILDTVEIYYVAKCKCIIIFPEGFFAICSSLFISAFGAGNLKIS